MGAGEVSSMLEAIQAISDEDITVALRIAAELQDGGRAADAAALVRLVARIEEAREEDTSWQDGLTPEDLAALERADADIAAGRVIPHEVVMQGRDAVEAYVRKRDGGQVDPETAAAVERYRRALQAEQPTAADA